MDSPLNISAVSDLAATIPGSSQSYRNNLELFSIPPTDVSVLSKQFVCIEPTNSISDENNPIMFNIPPFVEKYIDLHSSYLYIKAKIVKKDGGEIPANANIAPSNYFFYTLFSAVDVSLNGVVVTEPSYTYPYKVLMNYMCTKSKAEKKSFLTQELCYPDTAQNTFTDTNSGFKKRKEIAAGSKPFEMIGNIHASIFQQQRYLVPNVSIQLKLIRSTPEFCLEGSSNTAGNPTVACPYKVLVEECTFNLKVLDCHTNIMKLHKSLFSKGIKARYAYTDSKIVVSQVQSGTLLHLSDQIVTGKLPTYLIIGFIDALEFYGKWQKSCLSFENHGVATITIKTNHTLLKYEQLKVDFENDLYLRAYKQLYDSIANHKGIKLSRDSFKTSPLFVFQIISTATTSMVPELSGIIRVEVNFKSTTTKPINLLISCMTQHLLEIDHDLNIYYS